MNDVVLVGVVHRASQCFDELRRCQWSLRPAVERLGQARPLDELQRQKRTAILLADFVDLDDVRMLEARDGLCLGLADGLRRCRASIATVQQFMGYFVNEN